MNVLLARFFALTTFTALLLVPVHSRAGSTDVVTLQIDAAAIKQDARLEKQVSLSGRNIPLKSVLDQFAAQTGVAISMDDRDPASGYPVLINCIQIPVGRMMNALYGLFSIRRGEWAWGRSGKQGEYTYALHETPWAKNRTETYNNIVSGMLSNYLTVLRELAPMSMSDRKLHRGELKKALFVDDDARTNYSDRRGFITNLGSKVV